MHRPVGILILLAAFTFLALPEADAASSSYIARLGSTNGASRLTAGDRNSLYVNAKRLSVGTWGVRLYMGSCARRSTRIKTLPNLIVGSTRNAARTYPLSASQARLARTGVVVLSRGATTVCGSFAPAAIPVASARPSSPRPTSPSPSATASPSTPPASTPSTSPSSTPSTPGPSAPPPPPGTILLDTDGRGSTTTATFTVPSSWELDYIFSCAGTSPGFTVRLVRGTGPPQVVVSQAGSSGSDALMLSGAGSVRLELATACAWQVLVIAN